MKIKNWIAAVSFLVSSTTFASVYTVPSPDKAIIGQVQYTTAGFSENMGKVQERYNIGYNAVEDANPQIDVTKGIALGTTLQIPTQHLLPDLPREGIVVNLPEMRMYYYLPNTKMVYTYPIGIGKIGKTIPLANTAITRKEVNPAWIPPSDIREWNLEAQGIVLPQIMPAGPENPLGPYAIYMEIPTFLIHSTIFPESIGKRASFGCIRMYESDIKQFFPTVERGVPVAIINMPTKTAWQNDNLYMESFRALEEQDQSETTFKGMVHIVNNATETKPTLVDWQAISYLSQIKDGIPHEVGVKIKA